MFAHMRPHWAVSLAIHYCDTQSFPWGRENTITLYELPSADITICETQGELAVFHMHPPPSLIGSHYTYVILALLIQTQCFLLWTHVDIYFPQAQARSLS